MTPSSAPLLEPFVGRGGLARCPRCALHLHACMCVELRALEVATRVVVLSHYREEQKPTSSARLVALVLAGSAVRVVGRAPTLEPIDELRDANCRALLLYPTPDSRPLERSDGGPGPLTLIVPDGNWRQARKIARREPGLAALPRVHVSGGAPSRYRLRHHPNPRFLATFEAIARALGVFEGPQIEAELLRVFEIFVERAWQSRGRPDSIWPIRGIARDAAGAQPEASNQRAVSSPADGRPHVLTEEGRPKLVVQDAAECPARLEAHERAEAVQGIRAGLESMRRGAGRPAREVFDELRRKHDIPSDA